MNSYDHLTRRGIIETPRDFDAWLRARHLPPGRGPTTPAELKHVHVVREALRQVLHAHNGAPLRRRTLILLKGAADLAPTGLHFDREANPRLTGKSGGVHGAVSAVLAAAAEGADRGMWPRLKACRECGWAFYDRSKNRSGSWCTMSMCGSRAKMRAFRRRQKARAHR